MNMLRKIQYNSPVILTFTLLSFLALVLGELTNKASTILFFSVYRSPLTDILFYFRLVGHVLGHADLEHFLGNFLLILLVGPMLEEKYGWKVITSIILITAIITGALNIILFDTALLGASGIVFMFILLSSFTNTQEDKVPLTFLLIILLFIGREIMGIIFAKDNISQLTHIVGGLCGSVFGFYINKNKNRRKKLEINS